MRNSSTRKNILFLGTYPEGLGASQRFRLEIYLQSVSDEGFDYDYKCFLSPEDYSFWYSKGFLIKKSKAIITGLLKRFSLLFRIQSYDLVFVQREALPVGPPILEFLISQVFRIPLVYDFDDAIWMVNHSEANAYFKHLKCFWKVKHIIRYSSITIVGNHYLADYALHFNKHVKVIPTIVDTDSTHNPVLYNADKSDRICIGWTGSVSTNRFIENMIPLFDELVEDHDFELRIISNAPLSIERDYIRFTQWSRETEMETLALFDYGIMPLDMEDSFAKGKCGFKIIQYMAMGIVPIASPLGVNKEIIDHGVTGYLCSDKSEWKTVLNSILSKPTDNHEMGQDARQKIIDTYSLNAQRLNFLSSLNGYKSDL